MSLPRILKSLGTALLILTVLVYLGYLAVYVAYAVDLFHWPFDYDQGEGFELYDAILYSQGEWPYRDNAVYPFYASNYPPLFHLLIVPLLPIFGPQLDRRPAGLLRRHAHHGGTIFVVVRRKVRRLVHPAHLRAGLPGLQLRLPDRAAVPDAHDDGDVRDAGNRLYRRV